MASSRSTIIILLLAVAGARILRSYCPSNTDSFDHAVRRSMDGYFKNAETEVNQKVKAFSSSSKSGKKGASKPFAGFVADFKAKAQFVHDANAPLSEAQVVAYCEGLVGLYNYLMGACKDESEFANICMTYAEKIDGLFGKSKGEAQSGKGRKKQGAYQPVTGSSGTPRQSNRNKYAHIQKKNKQHIHLPPVDLGEVHVAHKEVKELPEDLPTEQLVKVIEEVKQEELKEAQDSAVDTPIEQVVTGPANEEDEENGELPMEAINQAEGVLTAEQLAPVRKVRRIIVLEVLSCNNCVQDETVKKYFVKNG